LYFQVHERAMLRPKAATSEARTSRVRPSGKKLASFSHPRTHTRGKSQNRVVAEIQKPSPIRTRPARVLHRPVPSSRATPARLSAMAWPYGCICTKACALTSLAPIHSASVSAPTAGQ
jgi:hypothetical protein